MLAVGIIELRDHDGALLAMEPDGARRWALDEIEIESPSALGEGITTLFGTPARWYALRGVADELGPRDIVVARVQHGPVWIVAVAATRPGQRARLDALLSLFELARIH